MTIAWFGIYLPKFGRNKVYMAGLRQNGVNIIECRDDSPGPIKFLKLWQKHRKIKNDYDFLVVGYPGHIVTPLARLISNKPVVLDALCTLYEGEVISRGKYKNNPFMRGWVQLIDYLAVKSAHLVLVETEAQRKYFIDRFKIKESKVARVFTGVDETVFGYDSSVIKHPIFTAVFRGRLLPEAGVKHVIKAAKFLENEGVNFLVIGGGHLEKEVRSLIADLNPKNLEWISQFLPNDEVRKKILECHVSLGQFEDHDRLKRTIPHKAFEALSMQMPYVTSRTDAVQELFTDKKDVLLVNQADPEDLADKITELKNNPELAKSLVQNGMTLYESTVQSKVLGKRIVDLLADLQATFARR